MIKHNTLFKFKNEFILKSSNKFKCGDSDVVVVINKILHFYEYCVTNMSVLL